MFNKKGFSLAELLIVMFIISTLGIVGMQVMGNQRITAKDTARKQTLQNLQWALESYYNKNGFYPQPAVRYINEVAQAEGWMEWVRNVWGFVPPMEDSDGINSLTSDVTEIWDNSIQYPEAIPSCKIKYDIWDEWEKKFPIDEDVYDYETDFLNDFHCGGVIKDRSGRVIIWWKGTLSEFSGKNSSSSPYAIYKNDDSSADWQTKTHINPITDRDLIIAKFDDKYFKGDIIDPDFSPELKKYWFGQYIYSGFRKGIDIANNGKNTNKGSSSYQLASSIENGSDRLGYTSYIIGNYTESKAYKSPITDEAGEKSQIYVYPPYSLIGSRNFVLMNNQQTETAPTQESCPVSDRYNNSLKGTDKTDALELLGTPCGFLLEDNEFIAQDELPLDQPVFNEEFSDIELPIFEDTNTSGWMWIPYPIL